MRILLPSSQGYGLWFGLRLMREGHSFDWFVIDDAEKRVLNNCLKGIIPLPLEGIPNFSEYDLVLFDSTGHGELADESAKCTPTLGDSMLASRLEDDRLFGLQVMENCGIEVPKYSVFQTPEEAKAFLEENPKRYVYKPFEPPEETEHQESDCTFVADTCEELVRCIDKLFERALGQPFILQEVVEGTECATNGYFDGQNFFFITHTIEEKKFMSGCFGPNTGCAGNLIVNSYTSRRLVSDGLLKLVPFLREANFRGPLDLNTICNEQHIYGLEFTSRFGYDSSCTEFSLIDGQLGQFLFDIATGPVEKDPDLRIHHNFSAAARYTIPPYPTEIEGKHPKAIPIEGVCMGDAWKEFYLYDAMIDRTDDEGERLCTAGITGFIGCPIARGNTPESAWDGVERVAKSFKVPNLQLRDDLKEATIERYHKMCEMAWL